MLWEQGSVENRYVDVRILLYFNYIFAAFVVK